MILFFSPQQNLTYNHLALDGVDPKDGADKLMSKIVPLGQRFYPSESAFPLRKPSIASCPYLFLTLLPGHIATLLVRFSLSHKGAVPAGWAPRILVQCGVAYPEIWDIIHGMYESQVCFIVLAPRNIVNSGLDTPVQSTRKCSSDILGHFYPAK